MNSPNQPDMSDFSFEFSSDDLTQSRPIAPGWYKGTVISVEKKLSKDAQSTNYIVHFEISGVKNEDGTVGKRKRYRLFNSKAMSFAEPFITAAMEGKPVKAGVRYTFASSIGKQMDVAVANRLFNNRLVDDLKDFKILSL